MKIEGYVIEGRVLFCKNTDKTKNVNSDWLVLEDLPISLGEYEYSGVFVCRILSTNFKGNLITSSTVGSSFKGVLDLNMLRLGMSFDDWEAQNTYVFFTTRYKGIRVNEYLWNITLGSHVWEVKLTDLRRTIYTFTRIK